MVYSGEASRAQHHFEKIGHPCPPGYNIADYLIDLTVEASGDHRQPKVPGDGVIAPVRPNGDAENGFAHPRSTTHSHDEPTTMTVQIKQKAHKLLGAFTSTISPTPTSTSTSEENVIPEKLASLVLASRASDDAKIVEAEIGRIQNGESPDGTRDVGENDLVRGYKKAGLWTQFKLLSGRAFKNLYRSARLLYFFWVRNRIADGGFRNPLLMATHYAVAIIVALICGFFFYKVTNDIPGFQSVFGHLRG